MLKIKKSHRGADEWIVYCPDNFKLHTHCRSLRVALVIRNNVNKYIMPKSTNIQLLRSHIRVTKNKRYISMIEERIEEILQQRKKEREDIGD